MAFDPNASATKWQSRLGQAASDGTIQRGIAGVTVSPGQAAARQADVWVQNTTAAKATWQKNVGAVTLPEWQQAMTEKALPRIQSGATAAEGKMAAFLTKLAPVINNAKAQLPPRGNFQQNLARATAMATALHNAKGQFK